jgi:hypothetical protein
MSHSSPGAGEQDLTALSKISAEAFAYILASMYQFEQINILFMPLVADEKYRKNNPYEHMLLQRFVDAHLESIKAYKGNLFKHFGLSDKQYAAMELFLRTPKPIENITPETQKFCQATLGIPSTDNAKTKKTLQFIANLFDDKPINEKLTVKVKPFKECLIDEIVVCTSVHIYSHKSDAIEVALNIKESKNNTPLGIALQFIPKLTPFTQQMIDTEIKIPGLDFKDFLEKCRAMAGSIKPPENYNKVYLNVARLLSVIQSLEEQPQTEQTRELLNLLKFSATLPRADDNLKIHKVPLSKEGIQNVANARAHLTALKNNEADFIESSSKVIPNLPDVLKEIHTLLVKLEDIPEVKDSLSQGKVSSTLPIEAEDMDYTVNRYLYAFTPPKPSISTVEAETILKYIQERNPKLTSHSVLVLQHPEVNKSKSAALLSKAASSVSAIRRRGSSMAETKTTADDSPPRVASPMHLVAAGNTFEDLFPHPEQSGMKVPPPPLPTKVAPVIPNRSYDKAVVRRSLEKAAAPASGKPPLPPRSGSVGNAAAPKAATAATAPVTPKTAVTIPREPSETAKPAAPIVNSKRASYTPLDKNVNNKEHGPSKELAEKLDYRRKKSDVDLNKGNPPPRKPSSSQ